MNKQTKNKKIMLKSKRSQLKIQEMSFMLIALILFFVIAALFYIVISANNLTNTASSLEESKAISTIERLALSPEFECSGGSSLCVDLDKITLLKDRPAYANYWNIKGLVIKKVYPSDDSASIECGFGNYDNCNTITIIPAPSTDYLELFSFVILCRQELKSGYSYDKCEIGKISAYVNKSQSR